MKIIFLSIEFSISCFSGNGIYSQSQVRSLKQVGHSVLTICGYPNANDPSSILVDERNTVLGIPLPTWGCLDATCSWKDYAKGCQHKDILDSVLSFKPDIIVGIDWHSVTAYQNLTAAINQLLLTSNRSDDTAGLIARKKPYINAQIKHNAIQYRSDSSFIIDTACAWHVPFAYSNYRVYHRSIPPPPPSSDTSNEKDIHLTERNLIHALEGQALQMSCCSTVLSRSDKDYVQEHFQTAIRENKVQHDVHVLLCALRSDMASIPPPSDESWLHNNDVAKVCTRDHSGRVYLTCCVRASIEKEPHRFVDLVIELEKRGIFDRYGIVPLVAGAGWADADGLDSSLHEQTKRKNTYACDLRVKLQDGVPRCQIIDRFLGPQELAEIYAKTLLNVHPCAYDAYGMTCVEAASQGAPTLLNIGNHVGASDLLDPGQGLSLEFDVASPVHLFADEVERLLGEREALMRIGADAMRAARGWSEDENARCLAGLLEQGIQAYTTMYCNGDGSGSDGGHSTTDTTTTTPNNDGDDNGTRRGMLDVRDASTLRYTEFVERYLARNIPVVLQNIFTRNRESEKECLPYWRAADEWVLRDSHADDNEEQIENTGNYNDDDDDNDSNGMNMKKYYYYYKANIEFLEQHFGDAVVTVTDTALHHEGNGPCKDIKFSEYCSWWKERALRTHHCDDTGYEEMWYLKDWHFADMFPEYQAYKIPHFFRDDWLNEWFDHLAEASGVLSTEHVLARNKVSDYRFVYMGPAGSFTPLHTDVLMSHSWSVNVCGRKRWRLLHPKYADLLKNKTKTRMAYDFYADDEDEYPWLCMARNHVIEVIQYPCEAIFVPSMWYHTVENMDDVISINHNWISTSSIMNSFRYLEEERKKAEELIEDCKAMCSSPDEFEALVQRNVKMNCGMDNSDLGNLLRYIVHSALEKIDQQSNEGVDHQKERLMCATRVLEEMIQSEEESYTNE